jgi:Fe-S oxidoreductase/nitrate reductase gamma subunit
MILQEKPMELTRELYWNVGHGAPTLVPMYFLFFLAIGLAAWFILHRLPVYKQGQSIERTDQLEVRVRRALMNILQQKKVTKTKPAGLDHGLFFWGFGILTAGTTLVFIQADFTAPLFGGEFLKGWFYVLFSLVLDVAGLVCIVMLVRLLLKKYRDARDNGPEILPLDFTMHGLLIAVLLTGFIIEGARMAATELGTGLSYASPVGLVFALPISGIEEAGLLKLHRVMWWLHLALVMCFIILIPLTRLKHVYTISANYLFESLGPKGKLVKLDLEDENNESFGATNIEELTWKDIFDTDACISCMRCQENCPAFNTGKPLSPMEVIHKLGDVATVNQKANFLKTVGDDSLWSCTTCGACQVNCPAVVEHINKIVEMRRAAVLMHAEFPGELMETFNNLENQSNPWGFDYASRADWCKNLDVPIMAEKGEADVLWFVGCAGSFEDKSIKISKAMVSILNKAGVDFAILGQEEKCNGDMARRCGNEYLAQMMIAENVETLNQYKPKRILTGCPHCYNTIKNEYPEFGAEYDVVSHVEFINELIIDGRLQVKGDLAENITFHDSCYFGRWNDIYEAPRKVLSAINRTGDVVEMEKNRDLAMCCGAGGGRMFLEEDQGERINNSRCQQAIDTGANTITSACPFCLTMLSDGLQALEGSQSLKDIAQLVDSVT